MTTLRLVVTALCLAAGAAYAQNDAKPADGAIKGGTILPGEQSGLPDERKMRERCEELSGTLREDCLKQQRDAGMGGTVKPLEERVSEPRTSSPERAGSKAGN